MPQIVSFKWEITDETNASANIVMTIATTIVCSALLCAALLFCICKSQQINETFLIYEAEFKLRKSPYACCVCVCAVCCMCVCAVCEGVCCVCAVSVCVLCVLLALLTLCCFCFFLVSRVVKFCHVPHVAGCSWGNVVRAVLLAFLNGKSQIRYTINVNNNIFLFNFI